MGIFKLNTDFCESHFEKEKYLLAWKISFTFMLFYGVLTLTSLSADTAIIVPYFSSFIVGLVCITFLQVTKNYIAIFWIFAITGTIILNLAMNLILDIPHLVDIIWILVVVFTAFVGINKKTGFVFLILNSLGILFYNSYSINENILSLNIRTNEELISDNIEMGLALFVFGYMLFKFIELQSYSESKIIKINNDLQEKNTFIASQNEENKLLVQEVHHRVKNNLQIMISLLRLQQNDIESEDVKNHFSEAIKRIMVMSVIHQKLYKNEDLTYVTLQDYLNDITKEILYISDSENITFKIKTEIKKLGLKTIVPLGLIINELVSNSIKHAFSNSENSLIRISINKKDNNHFELIYSDNGSWRDPAPNYSSFGLELIEILTSQLEGTVKREVNVKGTYYYLTLENLDLIKK